ncbi:MAG: poly-gamma-glutamate synthesis protein (capsule biosynthesis protein) [Parcubacteria bacterium C7867-006]|nr:MAG: poly-gamma-glutamate synthesis protein (capsule biosynthesis protein) [Parcubacteria bacterium C7867-006]
MRKILLYAFYLLVVLVLFGLFVFIKKPEHIVFPNVNIFRNETVSVLNFGDVMFDRGVRNIIENRKRDPFEYIKKDLDLIKKYDVVIANLEGPIVEMDRSLCQQKAYNFQFASNTTERLKSVGINMVNIANNHSHDCYSRGVESTKNYLQKAGIDYVGDIDTEKSASSTSNSYVVKNINGKSVVFVGIDQTVGVVPVSDFYGLIKKLKTENDFVVVNIHWGTEYELTETSTQSNIAHRLIDSGADVIFGHHPHVIEPVIIYKGKAIFYSLGNFVFDQVGENENSGIGVGAEFRDGDVKFEILPYKIKIFAPDFLKGIDKNNFCEKFLKDIEHGGCSFELTTGR